jgi:hypothetical protein
MPPLYHWSPRARRRQIERYGLRPGMRPTITSPEWRAPYVCLAENPDWAWRLSGALRSDEITRWDLWQVWLAPGHKICRLRNWEPVEGRRWHEIRVFDRVYKRGIIWIAERSTP